MDTYQVILDDVHFEALGTDEEEARKYLQSWLHEFTEGYKLRRFYLKKRFDQDDCRVVKGAREQSPRPHTHRGQKFTGWTDPKLRLRESRLDE